MNPHVYLGHGAAGTAASMQPYVDGLALYGVEATAVELRRGRSLARAEVAVDTFLAAVEDLASAVIGGHSYGGRVASLLAAREQVRALVLFSYPLHRPGQPDIEARTAHWPAIRCPVLLLSGERDTFARVDLLREAVGRLRDGMLITYPGVGHGLGAQRDAAIERAADFIIQAGD